MVVRTQGKKKSRQECNLMAIFFFLPHGLMLHHFSLFKIIDENFHKVNNLVLEICCNFHAFPSTNFALMKQVILLFDDDAKIKP